jgi:hypothetical protein
MIIYAPPRQPSTRNVGNKLLELCDEEYVYIFEYNGARFKLVFKKGYLFDAASIPWFAWSAIRLTPQMMEGEALAHDGGYQDRGDFMDNDHVFLYVLVDDEWHETGIMFGKMFWDALLRELCHHFRNKDCGNVSVWQARVVWAAVATFGMVAWYRDDWKRKQKKLEAPP